MQDWVRQLGSIIVLLGAVGVHWIAWLEVRSSRWVSDSQRRLLMLRILLAFLVGWVVFSAATNISLQMHLATHGLILRWITGTGLAWGFVSMACLLVWWLWKPLTRLAPDPARRDFLLATGGALAAAPAAVAAYGIFIERSRYEVKEVEIGFPKLPRDLDGLRLVQLSDIHLGAFLDEREYARVVDMANELNADIAFVTGDLVSAYGDPIDAALRHSARLRSTYGIWGCHGNHEVHAGVLQHATREGRRLNIHFLRQQQHALRIGTATLNLVGVDYQRKEKPYLVGAERAVRPDAFHLLLSHNPDVFPVAARQGYDLTLAGHTHGGQVQVEILDSTLSVSRFFTPYTQGLYRQNQRAIYVTRGIGTVGIPVRIGATPEITSIKLCAT
jgi:uncharacterized protein